MVCAALQRRRRPSAWGHGLLGRARHARGLADALAAGNVRVRAKACRRLLRTARGAARREGGARCGRVSAPCGLLSEPNLAGRRAGCGCQQRDLWRGGGAQASDRRTLPCGLPAGSAPAAGFAQSRRAWGPFMRQSQWQVALVVRLEAPAAVVNPAPHFSHAAVCVKAAAAAAWGIMP